MWGSIQRRLQPIRTGVFFLLIISLLVPYPAIVAAQEAADLPNASEETVSSEETTAPPESAPTPETAEESTPVESEEESEDGDDEEPPPEGLLDEQEPDPAYGDERAPRVRQPVVEPDQLDGSLRYLHPLTIPPGRNGMEPDLALVYSSRPDEQISPFGYGWSINIPYIERVNRYGVDRLYTDDIFY